MRRSIWMLSMALATLLSAGSASAALTLDLNQSLRVALHGTAANVFVADPAVADVAMIDPHSVIVLGKGYGVTQVLVTDHSGHTLMDSAVAVIGSGAGRVTVYRGVAAQDYHCSSRCETMTVAGGAPGGGSPNSGGGGDNAPLNVGPPVTATPVSPVHP